MGQENHPALGQTEQRSWSASTSQLMNLVNPSSSVFLSGGEEDKMTVHLQCLECGRAHGTVALILLWVWSPG